MLTLQSEKVAIDFNGDQIIVEAVKVTKKIQTEAKKLLTRIKMPTEEITVENARVYDKILKNHKILTLLAAGQNHYECGWIRVDEAARLFRRNRI